MTVDLKAKLKKADSIVREYVTELEKRNAKLQLQIIKLEADKVERDNRIEILEKEVKRPEFKVHVNTARHEPTEAEIIERAKALGYRLEKIA